MSLDFTPVNGLIGGALIGLAAVLLLIANGRIAGVSGIVGGLLKRVPGDIAWRGAFVLGLWLGALVYWMVRGEPFEMQLESSLPLTIAAGLLVGLGTRLGSGCTSGHSSASAWRYPEWPIPQRCWPSSMSPAHGIRPLPS